MYTIQDFKIGDRVKGRKGNWTFEGVVASFSKRKHIFIRPNESLIGEHEYYHRVLPHWITEIVDKGNK
jgi:hypothetical protein